MMQRGLDTLLAARRLGFQRYSVLVDWWRLVIEEPQETTRAPTDTDPHRVRTHVACADGGCAPVGLKKGGQQCAVARPVCLNVPAGNPQTQWHLCTPATLRLQKQRVGRSHDPEPAQVWSRCAGCWICLASPYARDCPNASASCWYIPAHCRPRTRARVLNNAYITAAYRSAAQGAPTGDQEAKYSNTPSPFHPTSHTQVYRGTPRTVCGAEELVMWYVAAAGGTSK